VNYFSKNFGYWWVWDGNKLLIIQVNQNKKEFDQTWWTHNILALRIQSKLSVISWVNFSGNWVLKIRREFHEDIFSHSLFVNWMFQEREMFEKEFWEIIMMIYICLFRLMINKLVHNIMCHDKKITNKLIFVNWMMIKQEGMWYVSKLGNNI
jgi:hypothetical protein